MSDQPGAEDHGSGDYAYDEAHAVVGLDLPAETSHEEHAPIYVSTQTSDDGGDYSYDLAHDIPPATGR